MSRRGGGFIKTITGCKPCMLSSELRQQLLSGQVLATAERSAGKRMAEPRESRAAGGHTQTHTHTHGCVHMHVAVSRCSLAQVTVSDP